MKKKKNIWFLLIIILICCFFTSDTAKAAIIPQYAWRDDAGNVLIRTQDTKITTSRYGYRTIGWTVTRCKLGTRERIEDQYFTFRLNDLADNNTEVIIGDQVISCFILSEATMLQRIAEISPDWLADIQSGEICYLMFDAIMVTFDRGRGNIWDENNIEFFSGFINSEANQDYIENIFNEMPGIYDKYTYKELMYNTYGWANPKAIETHYNIPLLYNGGEPDEPIISDEYVTTIGKDKPEYYTWNTSNEFDLSEGIPSGENITNGYGADKWYGNVSISRHSEERTYRLSYDLMYHTYSPLYAEDPETGTYITDDEGNPIQVGVADHITHVPESFMVTRKASYYYASGINLYELQEVNVANSTYPGDFIRYLLSGVEIPMKVILDGEENPKEVINWMSEPDKHIIWPEAYTNTIQIDCGEGPGSVTAMINHLKTVLYDDEITGEDYIKEVISWNDLVEINGVKYMDNLRVSHANDTSKVIKEFQMMTRGKDDAMYLFHEKEKTVTIPTDVANGAYPTGLEVIYRKRALDNGRSIAFTADPETTIYQHLKPGYEKNEPVYVHTPVISPVSIKNGEDGTQLVTENKTAYEGWVDKDGRVPDRKAIYELILDNVYSFEFDPALHREIQGYGWSGDPSKYDKYVKGKYVAFPFTVQVEVEGKWSTFYEIDDSTHDVNGESKLPGYTQWIEVANNETNFYIPSWAKEGTYYEIQYKVEAYNVFDENGNDHSDKQEGTSNETLDENKEAINYVATYVVPIELSGIIYDFEIIGTNAYEKYNKELEPGELAFAPRKWEKKQGNKNRLGETAVRYTLDGEITHNWEPVNVLPLSKGSSEAWSERGYLIGGETFTFSVKTIANLWDEGIDGIIITPTWRWYENNGTQHRDVQVYYWDDTKKNQLIRYGSPLDKAELTNIEDDGGNNSFSFWGYTVAGSVWDTVFTMNKYEVEFLSPSESDYTGNYHDPDLLYSVEHHNRNSSEKWTLSKFLKQESQAYCLSSIELNSKMRILTGKYEELARNMDKSRTEVETFNLDPQTYDKMRYSMQTWYGVYTIPNDVLICDADTFEKMGIPDHNGDGVADYWDYLVEKDTYVDKTEDFWLNKNEKTSGYAILNFDIVTVNDGKPHLTYHGGTKDMWQKQGPKNEIPLPTTTPDQNTPTIPGISGDIAIINPEESMSDRYNAGIFMIN